MINIRLIRNSFAFPLSI